MKLIDNKYQQYQEEVALHLRKLHSHLRTIEKTLALPTNSLSRLTYIQSATLHLQAKRVNDLSTPQGLLKFLMPKAGLASEAYNRILAMQVDSQTMHEAIYTESKKHSSGFGRLLHRWFSKPSMADQLYILAKYLADPTNRQQYYNTIQTEIMPIEDMPHRRKGY